MLQYKIVLIESKKISFCLANSGLSLINCDIYSINQKLALTFGFS